MNKYSRNIISKELSKCFEQLKDVVEIEGRHLRIGCQRTEKYNDLFWWSFKLKRPICGYTHIHFKPYCVTKNDVASYCYGMKRDMNSPDVDARGTGSFHPSKERVKNDVSYCKIMQLVMVSSNNKAHQYGPALPFDSNCYENSDCYEWNNTKVPRDNYYPSMCNVDRNSEKQRLMKRIVNILLENNLWFDKSFNSMAKILQLNPTPAKQDKIQQESKQLVIVPEAERLTFDGYSFGRDFSFKFRELIATNVVTMDRKGRKVAKRELVDYVRQETGNTMCRAEVAATIENAVSEYVDGFMDNLDKKNAQLCFSLMTKMIKRIEDEVWNVKRIVQ